MLLAGPAKRLNHRRAPRTYVAVTVVCLVLLALLAVVQVAHFHSLETVADHCPLCIAIHAAVPTAVAAAVILLVRVGTAATVGEPRAVVRHWNPTLFTRPPPAAR